MVDIRICMIKGTVRYGVKWLHFKNIVSRRFYRKGFYNGCETARKLNKEGMFCGREFGEQLCGRRCYEHILTKRGIYDTMQSNMSENAILREHLKNVASGDKAAFSELWGIG